MFKTVQSYLFLSNYWEGEIIVNSGDLRMPPKWDKISAESWNIGITGDRKREGVRFQFGGAGEPRPMFRIMEEQAVFGEPWNTLLGNGEHLLSSYFVLDTI